MTYVEGRWMYSSGNQMMAINLLYPYLPKFANSSLKFSELPLI